MKHYRITKYNPSNRDANGYHIVDDWTDVSDIAGTYSGRTLTRKEYIRVEDAYVEAVMYFMRRLSIQSVKVRVYLDARNMKELAEFRFNLDTAHMKLPLGVSSFKIEDGESLDTLYEYDLAGNLIKITDAANNTRTMEYDALNRATININPDGTQVRSIYDNRDNVLKVINEKGVAIRQFRYDRTNRKVREVWPAGQEYVYRYDPNGNLTEQIDAKGQSSRNVYDAENRLIRNELFQTASAPNPEKIITYAYNAMGRITSYDDGRTQGSYTYDKLQRKLTETVDYGPMTLSHSYTYTPNGNKASMTYPDGTTVEYSYNPGNRLNRLSIPDQGNITINAYNWSAPENITFPGGSVQQNTYDALLRVRQIAVQDPAEKTTMDFQYRYDTAGNITNKSTEKGNFNYTYDALDRLTSATHPSLEDEVYSYDSAGNRLTSNKTDDSEWNYNTNNQLLDSNLAQYSYDLNGSMVSRTQNEQTRHFIYNLQNRLTEVQNADGTQIAQYSYDPFGRRLSKAAEGHTIYYHYSDEGLITEYDASGDPVQTYGYIPGSAWGVSPMFTRIGAEYFYYLNDRSGTPRKLINSSGSVLWSSSQLSFGYTIIDSSSSITNKLRFAGQYFDEETGLHYNHFRYYDPVIGKYRSSDLIGIEGGLNTYSYANANPLRFIDPLGLLCTKISVNLEGFAACEETVNPDDLELPGDDIACKGGDLSACARSSDKAKAMGMLLCVIINSSISLCEEPEDDENTRKPEDIDPPICL